MRYVTEGQPVLVESKCRELLGTAERELHPYLTGSVYAQLLFAYREQYRLNEVDAFAAKARGVLERSGYDFALIAVLQPGVKAFWPVGRKR